MTARCGNPKPTIKRYQGDRVEVKLTFPINLEGYTAASQIRQMDGEGDLVATFETQITVNPKTRVLGDVWLRLSDQDSAGLTVGVDDLAFDVVLQHTQKPDIRTPRIWLAIVPGVTR